MLNEIKNINSNDEIFRLISQNIDPENSENLEKTLNYMINNYDILNDKKKCISYINEWKYKYYINPQLYSKFLLAFYSNQIYTWLENEIIPLFKEIFGDKIGEETIERKLKNSIILEDDETFKNAGKTTSAIGYNDEKGSHLRLNDNTIINIESIIIHESIHQISRMTNVDIADLYETLIELLGDISKYDLKNVEYNGVAIKIHNLEANEDEWIFNGINECITEMLTEEMIDSISLYDMALEELYSMIRTGILTRTTLVEAYFSHDINKIINALSDNLFITADEAIDLIKLFDKAINKIPRIHIDAIKEINEKVNKYVKKSQQKK